jgi:hypothetical protein
MEGRRQIISVSLNEAGCNELVTWGGGTHINNSACISVMLLDTTQHTVFPNARFKVVRALLMTITTFCNTTPCILV